MEDAHVFPAWYCFLSDHFEINYKVIASFGQQLCDKIKQSAQFIHKTN